MRTVRDDDGNRYLLLKHSAESSKVRDPETDETTYLDNEELDILEDDSPLETAAGAVPSSVRKILTAVPDERALGLLLELDARGPFSVRYLLDATDLCESDLLGVLTEFRAAGLLTETRVAGERGYETTEEASAGLAVLRDE
ncbi:DUF7346 family protein [Halorussus halophilus]|uniref:DUF7346 family protein n=1 Tax=Halorussus halophilus TaxID=2650975 RepID=UPI001301071C|nr:hypothetical protein [Halorussus halophilus]